MVTVGNFVVVVVIEVVEVRVSGVVGKVVSGGLVVGEGPGAPTYLIGTGFERAGIVLTCGVAGLLLGLVSCWKGVVGFTFGRL